MVPRAAPLRSVSAAGRAQLARARAFAAEWTPPRRRDATSAPVLVTAFGRFGEHAWNASAAIACGLLGAEPRFAPPAPADAIDEPSAHVAAHAASIVLPGAGRIELHVLVLPVHWDLAPLLALRAIASLRPRLVLMNGVGAVVQPIALEAGAFDRAAARADASGHLRPDTDDDGRPLTGEGPRTLSLSFAPVLGAAREVWSAHAGAREGGVRLDAIATGVELAPARAENAYLCNQLAFVVDRALAPSRPPLRLLRGADDERDDGGVDAVLGADVPDSPRGFVHWPSALRGAHRQACTDVLRAMVDAQLGELRKAAPRSMTPKSIARLLASVAEGADHDVSAVDDVVRSRR